jgi:hypothetical protein
MKVLASMQELTTAALRARLASCEQQLQCYGLKRLHRARLERQRSCAAKVLATRLGTEMRRGSNTEYLMLLAVEFGHRQCENGNNVQTALAAAAKLMETY